jgi:hypothetical protein
MALSKRERLIAAGTGAAIAVFVGNRYAFEPYMDARRDVASQQEIVAADLAKAEFTFDRRKKLDREWRNMLSGGLKADAGEAEQQLYEAVGDWARESGVTVLTSDPQRAPQRGRTQIVRLRVTGTGTTAAFSKLLWRVETSSLPVKVEEFTLTARTAGNDDLTMTLVVSTIWIRPPTAEELKGQRAPAPVRRTPAGDDDL